MENSLENTPTWAVSIVCFCLVLISLVTDMALHNLTHFIRRRNRKSLSRAIEKLKTEMMTMGFISLLLTVSEVPISKICVTEAVANSFNPCKDPSNSAEPTVKTAAEIPGSTESNTVFTDITDGSYCEAKGMVSVMSREGVMQLKIFISVLAVFHVFYCIFIMCLGMAKMRRWKSWEKETASLDYQIANDPRRFQLTYQTAFGQRHLKIWSHHPILFWPVCFIRQFTGSASKADYFTLRNGFIEANVAEGSHFNFHNFLIRAFDDDFEQIVGIRFWIWIFSMIFLFFTANVVYTYYWLPFIPLLLALIVGTKLQVVITKMCVESSKNSAVVRGTFPVKPSDDFFWFRKPNFLLCVLQLIFIQNSFQLAFFTWTWYEYGLNSCFNRDKVDFIIRITMGIAVQLLCGYVTLPIYAIVSQMGSDMKRTVFTERVAEGLKSWLSKARQSLTKNPSSSINSSMNYEFSASSNRGLHDKSSLPPEPMETPEANATETVISTPEIATDREEANSMAIISRGTYDGEISFGNSWKNQVSNRVSIEISSIIEEDDVSIVEGEFDDENIRVSNL